jgi:hypothetical protein
MRVSVGRESRWGTKGIFPAFLLSITHQQNFAKSLRTSEWPTFASKVFNLILTELQPGVKVIIVA